MSRTDAACVRSAAAVLFAALGVSGQQERAPTIAASVAALGAPWHARQACAALEAEGARAVPALVGLLAGTGHGAERELACCNALLVLGRLGERALTSIGEVRSCVAYGTPAVRSQAIWALGRLAPRTHDATIAREAAQWICLQATPELDAFVCRAAIARLRLAAGDSLQAVAHRESGREPLPYWDPGTLAGIADAIAAGEVEVPGAVLTALRQTLRRAVARADLPWRDELADRAAAGALAELFLGRGEPIAGDIALGLCEHWDPLLRQRAVAAFAPLADQAWAERMVLVAMLWDRDAGVRRAAVATLRAAGADGLIGLRALRAFAGSTDGFAADCDAAAEAIVAAAGACADAAPRTVLAELDDALRGRAVPQTAAPVAPAGAGAIAQVLFGCRGGDAAQLERMLAFAAARAPADADVAVAALQLLQTPDVAARRVVLRWLPHFAAGLAAACPLLHADLDVAVADAPLAVRGLALEAWAQVRVPERAAERDLIDALEGGNARLLARVAAEVAAHPASRPGLHAAAAALCVDPEVRLDLRLHAADFIVPWSRDEVGLPAWPHGSALAEATLALELLRAGLGVELPPCDAAVGLATALAPGATIADGADLAAWLRGLDAPDRLRTARALEDHLRARLGLGAADAHAPGDGGGGDGDGSRRDSRRQ